MAAIPFFSFFLIKNTFPETSFTVSLDFGHSLHMLRWSLHPDSRGQSIINVKQWPHVVAPEIIDV